MTEGVVAHLLFLCSHTTLYVLFHYLCLRNQPFKKGEPNMKATISLESLWQIIQSLSKSNKKWLSEKLLEDINEEETEYISKEEILAGIDAGLKEMQDRKRCGKKAKTLNELIDEL